MDIAAVIAQIKASKLGEDEKKLMVASLEKDGESALPEVLAYLELSAQNDEMSAQILQEEASSLSTEVADAVDAAPAAQA